MPSNLKNLIIGIILGLALGLAIGAHADKEKGEKGPACGRYQIAAHAYSPHYVVLDTQTGDVYSPTYHGQKQELYLTRYIANK